MPFSGPSPGQDDTSRLRRAADAGDRSALGRLMALNVGKLRRWAHGRLPRWTRTIADTSDLVQDAIVRTLGLDRQLRVGAPGALQAYLRQAITNRIADQHRTIARRGIGQPLDEQRPSGDLSPLDQASQAELEARYRAAVSRLREGDQQLVVGHVELDYTVQQLAVLSGRSVPATRMALRRALVRLAQDLEG